MSRAHVELRTDVFVSGTLGYHTFRIPSLVATRSGELLAFAEGRRLSVSDTGVIEIVLRRSADGGATWGPLEVVVAEAETTCGNATPVVTPAGEILLPFCKNRRDGPERLIFEGKAPRTAWLTRSADEGRTWAPPVDITPSVNRPSWSWFAFGPGHGVVLQSGRIVVPSVHAEMVTRTHDDPCRTHLTLSDDGGRTFRVGAVLDVPRSSENEVAEIAPGVLHVNARIEEEGAGRVSAWSTDGGETFSEWRLDASLPDPMCQGSLAGGLGGDPQRLALVHATGTKRERLTLRTSRDGGRTFQEALVIEPGRAAYSDVALTGGHTLHVLHERGERHAYERITLARVRIPA